MRTMLVRTVQLLAGLGVTAVLLLLLDGLRHAFGCPSRVRRV